MRTLRVHRWHLVLLVLAFVGPVTLRAENSTPPVYNWNLNPFNESQGYVLGRVVKAARVRPYSGVTGAIAGLFYSPLVAEVRLGTSTTIVERVDRDCLDQLIEKRRQEIEDSATLPSTTEGGSAQLSPNVDESSCRRRFTPMNVRTDDRRLIKKLTNTISEYKLIAFSQHRFILSTDVYDVVNDVYPVNPTHKFNRKFVDRIGDFPISSWFNVERGTDYGRIVRAEVEGNLRESYLVTVEVGTKGNQFVEMNITSSELYRFAIECMYSNQPLQLNYLDLSGAAQALPELVYGYRTKLRLYRIDVVDRTEP